MKYYIKNKQGQYYNEEDYEYLVETETPRPHTEAIARAWSDMKEDLILEEVE
jgi:hypothetical protein